MNKLPNNASKIEVPNSTVPFFKYLENELEIIYFDTSDYPPPTPMLNAMMGLKLLENKNQRLIMINHKPPMGLFPKIENDFEFELEEFENFVKVVFKLKHTLILNTDFNDNKCSG